MYKTLVSNRNRGGIVEGAVLVSSVRWITRVLSRLMESRREQPLQLWAWPISLAFSLVVDLHFVYFTIAVHYYTLHGVRYDYDVSPSTDPDKYFGLCQAFYSVSRIPHICVLFRFLAIS